MMALFRGGLRLEVECNRLKYVKNEKLSSWGYLTGEKVFIFYYTEHIFTNVVRFRKIRINYVHLLLFLGIDTVMSLM